MLLVAWAVHAQAVEPRVTVSYSPGLDAACSLVRGSAIKDEWKAELTARQAEFDDLWARVGPSLIEAVEVVTGKAFPSEDGTARLTLCNLPSQSMLGIIVNMRYALKSFTPTPVSMRYKVDTLFHELLHVVLARYPVGESALLDQHASETACTRNHLHLLALQKAVLMKLHDAVALQEVVSVDGQLPGGCYKNAWALVNATDTEYLRYVAELAK